MKSGSGAKVLNQYMSLGDDHLPQLLISELDVASNALRLHDRPSQMSSADRVARTDPAVRIPLSEPADDHRVPMKERGP